MSLVKVDDKLISQLREKIKELNEVINSQNNKKLDSKNKIVNSDISYEDEMLEAFLSDGQLHAKVIITKHYKSDFINISFIPTEGQILQIHVTENSYTKLKKLIDKFYNSHINKN